MSELPFKIEPDFDYILDEADRKKFAPLQVTDETWSCGNWYRTANHIADGFSGNLFYRRRKSSGWVSVKERWPDDGRDVLWTAKGKVYCGPLINRQSMWPSITHWMELPALPQPPRPAVEVAFEEWWAKESGINARPDMKGFFQITFLSAIDWAKSHKGEL